MAYTPATEKLIGALQCLPGIGSRSAARMALYLLERDIESAEALSGALRSALDKVHKCPQCRSLTEASLCTVCSDSDRDADLICVVASDADKTGIEMSGTFNGRYFVLHGVLSPIDGIGPDTLGIFDLADQIKDNAVRQVILALDEEMESEATVHYISEQLKPMSPEISRVHFHQMKSGALDKTERRVIVNAFAAKESIGFEHD
jgi:recombination protein RecR